MRSILALALLMVLDGCALFRPQLPFKLGQVTVTAEIPRAYDRAAVAYDLANSLGAALDKCREGPIDPANFAELNVVVVAFQSPDLPPSFLIGVPTEIVCRISTCHPSTGQNLSELTVISRYILPNGRGFICGTEMSRHDKDQTRRWLAHQWPEEVIKVLR